MDYVGFRENRASPREAWNASRIRHQARIVFDAQAETLHLILEERTGACGAAFVHGEPRRGPVFGQGYEACALPADLDNAARMGGNGGKASGYGRNILEHTDGAIEIAQQRTA